MTSMKKLYFIFILLLFSPFVFAQFSVKVYAYSQATTRGMIPVDENGNPIGDKESVNYFIYVAHSPASKISWDGIWIKGKAFSVQTSRVSTTPVTVTNNDIHANPVKTILVQATSQAVTSIQPIEPNGRTVRASWFRDMAKRNELIVSYYYKGKKYFTPVKKFKVLPPVSGM